MDRNEIRRIVQQYEGRLLDDDAVDQLTDELFSDVDELNDEIKSLESDIEDKDKEIEELQEEISEHENHTPDDGIDTVLEEIKSVVPFTDRQKLEFFIENIDKITLEKLESLI